ncbi:hypothetical protein BWI96_02295 [Siphonobacter sp. SORGH_AS_0500]|uniref:hypothetical protein n=1 Tax=Siphonobacter sp. SORGH_AS_0500 TaxID=1864824 RepID=UPI000CB648B0|nr:hypothetical protein [Siphonobacter sp. SORGH_AS_0500]PKK37942.1 hypothetical protein BWI96_02295 [Siphonobacter sp. SORGH_AS_0500]
MKVLIRFLLSLSFILLNGYSYSYASSYENPIHYSPVQIKKSVKEVSANEGSLLIKTIPFTAEEATDSIETAERKVEEEELKSLEKSLEVSQYFSSFYDALTSVYDHRYVNHPYSFYTKSSGTSANKYIVLRVLRL